MKVERIALIGLGLIGSSIARAVRAKLPETEVVGHAASEKTRARSRELGFCHRVEDSMAEAVKGADLVIACAPVGANADIAREIGPYLRQGAIVSDVGSVKAAVVRDMQPFLPGHVQFIPAIRSRGPKIPARMPALRRCSRTAGAFSRPCRQLPMRR